jgi:hypothetical protein
MNQTGFRNRGYGTGSIYAKWGEDNQYMQPGHALAQQTSRTSKAGVGFKAHKKNVLAWDPNRPDFFDEHGNQAVPEGTRLRSLDEL